jgi:hypothetical protein
MKRLVLGAAIVGLMAVGGAQADVAPPKGLKRIPLEYKITTDTAYADYAFFAISGGDKAEAVKLDPKTPATVKAGGGRYRIASLVAVPKDAAKGFPSEKDFLAAVAKEKVDGLVKSKTVFDAFTTVKDTDTRKTIVETYKVEKIDAKDGIVLKKVGEPRGEKKDGKEEESPAAALPEGAAFPWMAAGLAGAGVIGFAGLWLARRTRR